MLQCTIDIADVTEVRRGYSTDAFNAVEKTLKKIEMGESTNKKLHFPKVLNHSQGKFLVNCLRKFLVMFLGKFLGMFLGKLQGTFGATSSQLSLTMGPNSTQSEKLCKVSADRCFSIIFDKRVRSKPLDLVADDARWPFHQSQFQPECSSEMS
jgi:hypothetical protein